MNAYQSAMARAARKLRLSGSVIYPSGERFAIDGSDIIAFTLSEGDISGLRPGSVISGRLVLTLDDSSGQWEPGGSKRGSGSLAGARFSLSVGVPDGSDVLFGPLGTFICSDARKEENSPFLTAECHDEIYFAGGTEFNDALTYPSTLGAVFAHALSQAHLSCADAVPNGQLVIDAPPAWGRISVRRAMGHCAALMGAFICVDRAGNVRIKPLVSPGVYEVAPPVRLYRSDSLKPAEGINRLRAYTVNSREDTLSEPELITVSSGSMTEGSLYTIEGNPLIITGGAHARAIVEAVLSRIEGAGWTASRFEYRGDPSLTVGTRVRLSGGPGALETVLSRQTFIFRNGLYCKCACGGF